ncbi:hypothetical protein DAPPUDRAFT_306257 [Daphnia pulex]|uniref:Cyanophycinase n=1 Tax=Daphnia pulex TaxID=6669 RepID=E9GW50_DAPPU|nr:hypothetical protein DAPPUDRAFT_306257 [Daphnia pulex]|eukprot:EFX76327.1 hypothetical protein DAPPUDRAFT_306257 [Daphnia pulex]
MCRLISSVIIISWFTLTVGQNLVLIGGNLRNDNTQIWNKMVDLAGGSGVAKIGVISASKLNTLEGEKVIDNFVRLYGAKAIGIPVSATGANDPKVAKLVEDQTGIFIVEDSEDRSWNFLNWVSSLVRPSDGSEEPPAGAVCYESASYKRQNLIDTLRPSGKDSLVLAAIKTLLNRGGMVAGNAAVMSKSAIILGGDSISALVTGTRFVSFSRIPFSFRKEGGLNLLNVDYVIESQLSEKGREVRLLRTLVESDTPKGLGVDENAALIVKNPLTRPVAKVMTARWAVSGVLYLDVSDIPTQSIANALYENVTFSFFTVDDVIDLTTGEVTFPSWKTNITGQEWFKNAIPSNDILSRVGPSQWRETARRLIDCKELNVTNYSPSSIVPMIPAVRVDLDRTRAAGMGADLPGDLNNTYVASFQRMLASVKVLGIL